MPQLQNSLPIPNLNVTVAVSLTAQRPHGCGVPGIVHIVLRIDGPDRRYKSAVEALGVDRAEQLLDYLKRVPDAMRQASAGSSKGDFVGSTTQISGVSLDVVARAGIAKLSISMRTEHQNLSTYLTVDDVNLAVLHLAAGLLKTKEMLTELLQHATVDRDIFTGATLDEACAEAWLGRDRHRDLEFTVIDGPEPRIRIARGFGASRKQATGEALASIPKDAVAEEPVTSASRQERTINASGKTLGAVEASIRQKYPKALLVSSTVVQSPSNGLFGIFKKPGTWSIMIEIPESVEVQYREPYAVTGHWYSLK